MNKNKTFLAVSRITLGCGMTIIVYFFVGLLLTALVGKSVNSIYLNAIALITGALAGLFSTHKMIEIKFLFFKPNKPIFAAGITLCLSVGLTFVCNMLFTYIPFDKLGKTVTDYDSASYYTIPLWACILIYCFITPLAEEIFFRAVLFNQMKNIWPVWVAILVSAIIFGLYHGNIQQGLYAFIMGASMALIFNFTHNFLYTFAFHVIANAIANIASFNKVFSGFMYSIPGLMVGVILTIAGVVGLVFYCKEVVRIESNKNVN